MKYSEQDFETIYRATHSQLSRFLLAKTAQYDDAQDLLQELYFDFYKQLLCRTEPLDQPLAYLFTMAQHLLSRYYATKSKREVTVLESQTQMFEDLPDAIDLETEVLEHLSLEEIWNQIEHLKEPDRSLVIARYRFDMTYLEISQQFEIPESTVKDKIYASIRILRKKSI